MSRLGESASCSRKDLGHKLDALRREYEQILVKLETAEEETARAAEQIGNPDRAYSEFQSLAATYPTEKLSLQAQLSAARIALKKLNRPEDALRHFEDAQKSPVPHLDIESVILAGIRDSKNAIANPGPATPATA